MVRLIHRPKHKAKTNYAALIKGEWLCLVNYVRYFAFKNK